MKYPYVLFDLDGTLTDPYEGITRSVVHALNKYGIKVEDRNELKCFIGPPLTESFERYFGFGPDEAVRAVDYYREHFATKGLYENEVYPGIADFLSRLCQKGHKLYLATSKPRVFAQRILERFELAKYFCGVYGSELDGTRVKKGEVIAYLLECEAIPAESAVMIGDRFHDIVGARQCGVDNIGVLWGYGSSEELAENGCHRIAATVEELEAMICI